MVSPEKSTSVMRPGVAVGRAGDGDGVLLRLGRGADRVDGGDDRTIGVAATERRRISTGLPSERGAMQNGLPTEEDAGVAAAWCFLLLRFLLSAKLLPRAAGVGYAQGLIVNHYAGMRLAWDEEMLDEAGLAEGDS